MRLPPEDLQSGGASVTPHSPNKDDTTSTQPSTENAPDADSSEGLASLTPQEKRKLTNAGRLYALADVLWIPQAWVIADAISRLLVAGDTLSGFAISDLWFHLFGLVALSYGRMRINLLGAARARLAAHAVKTRVRERLLTAIAKASPASRLPASGEIAAHVGDQVDILGPYLSRFYPQKIRLGLVPIAIVLATLSVSWLAALILMVTGPVIPLFMALIGLRAKSASEKQQGELTRMSGFLLDRIKGLETLRLFGAVDRTRDEIVAVGQTFRKGTMRVLRIAFLSSTVLELFSALGIAFVAVYVGFSLLGDVNAGTWGAALSFGSGLFILLLAPEFFAPLRAYAAAYHDRAAGLAATDKLSSLYDEICRGAEQGGALPSQGNGGNHAGPGDRDALPRDLDAPAIAFENVSLAFGERNVLSSLSLTLESGQKALLVGPSGAGKTTIIDCLLGLHDLDGGRILIAGQDLAALDLEAWRGAVAWVGQAPRLFHGSIKANLLRAHPEASEADMWEALALAGARRLVEGLPRGLGTIVGEDGFGLSVGEMRRIALARAAIRKSAVLVLADEPTAGLDDETAADVIAGLEKMAVDRTFLAATHDPKLMSIGAREIRVRPSGRDEEASA
ncbi:thiol reductant ABC exporter subunit CydD [Roseibium sp.]|uniref:thiol reductant ABC exporter subunit CydD n=1 Tax=Roseibium sp. TaxID=1936156 RepID=UPI003A9738BE